MLKTYDVLADENLTTIIEKARTGMIKFTPEVWGNIVGITAKDEVTNSTVTVISDLVENLTYVGITEDGEIAFTLAKNVQAADFIGTQITTLRVTAVSDTKIELSYVTADGTILTDEQEAILQAFTYGMITVLRTGGEQTYIWELLDTDAQEIVDPTGQIELSTDLTEIGDYWSTLMVRTTAVPRTVPTTV